MSRGISTQQQQILGAAVAISRIRNGKPVARTPQRHPRFRVLVVTGVWPDISTYIASHLVGRVGLRRRNRWLSRLETTPTALATRSSISRAISLLLKRGLLASKWRRPAIRWNLGLRPDHHRPFRWTASPSDSSGYNAYSGGARGPGGPGGPHPRPRGAERSRRAARRTRRSRCGTGRGAGTVTAPSRPPMELQ